MKPAGASLPDARLPDDAALAAALAPLVACDVADRAGVRLVARRPNEYCSSSPTEIVSLALSCGTDVDLFVKYDRPAPDTEPRCRNGVAYCGLVYDRIVQRLSIATARSLGVVMVGNPPAPAIVLDHLSGALRVNEAPDESGIIAAAEWIGRLHSWGTARVDDPTLGFLATYDLGYYRAWSTRARRLVAAAGTAPGWLERACAAFDARAGELVAAERTVIHGEYGPQNVLWRDGIVYPIDWESAAVGPGVIDLATLLFDWPTDTVRHATDAYWRARGTAAPPGFAAAFATATLFAALRWLPDAARGDDAGWQAGLARLERIACRIG